MTTYGSVCSGIESASVAWELLGMQPVWFSEVEPFPCAVLAHHWPGVVNLGDMTALPALVRAGVVLPPDVLVGGTPCQAFSVAGKRGSLDDDRGQLTLSYVELLNAIDEQRPDDECVAVWENVPGVLSTKDNAFGCFLGELAGSGHELQPGERPPVGKSSPFWRWDKKSGIHVARWPNSGSVRGPRRTIAWRVLDAQYFGVAQRRRRVFLVTSARNGFNPAKVLFEPEGVRRNTAPSREAGTAVAACADGGSHWDNSGNAHPTLNQSHNTGGIGASNQEIFSQRGAGLVPSAVAVRTANTSSNGWGVNTHTAYTLDSANGQAVSYAGAVRRLTPTECERLQGLPDGHTLVPYRGKPATDGPRYKAIGNSKAVPVVRWVGRRVLNER